MMATTMRVQIIEYYEEARFHYVVTSTVDPWSARNKSSTTQKQTLTTLEFVDAPGAYIDRSDLILYDKIKLLLSAVSARRQVAAPATRKIRVPACCWIWYWLTQICHFNLLKQSMDTTTGKIRKPERARCVLTLQVPMVLQKVAIHSLHHTTLQDHADAKKRYSKARCGGRTRNLEIGSIAF
jgi:hypothetical protein